jgi:two-component system nitrogen regulation sensor histidine kinase NtrY
MKLRTKFILFVSIIHGTALALSFITWCSEPLLFICAEVLILVSLLLSWSLYRQMLRPLRLLMEGIEAIKDKDFTVKFRTTGKYEMDKLIEVYNRMIDELRTERTLQEEQHFFLEKLIQTSPTGIIILNYDGEVVQINPRASAILGGTIPSEVFALPSGESRLIKLGGAQTYKIQKAHFMDRGFLRHFIMIEELTAEILAAEKNVYGKVIRMMAHEVNNTIGPVNSIIQSTLDAGGLPVALSEALKAARERNQNLNLFVRNFADLVKLPAPGKRPMDVNVLVHHVATVLAPAASDRAITFRFQLSPGPFIVSADQPLMEQALINIVKNALEAIDRDGIVTFSTFVVSNRLVITDTGKGVESQEPLFSPFYSTKKDGQGIGLTLIREILSQHGFDFSLKTVAPGRTEFAIQF